jgi:hypothetical protein
MSLCSRRICVDHELDWMQLEISPRDREIWTECERYLVALEDLARSLLP